MEIAQSNILGPNFLVDPVLLDNVDKILKDFKVLKPLKWETSGYGHAIVEIDGYECMLNFIKFEKDEDSAAYYRLQVERNIELSPSTFSESIHIDFGSKTSRRSFDRIRDCYKL